MFGFVYKSKLKAVQGKNNLKDWLFVNNTGVEVRHQVGNFKVVH